MSLTDINLLSTLFDQVKIKIGGALQTDEIGTVSMNALLNTVSGPSKGLRTKALLIGTCGPLGRREDYVTQSAFIEMCHIASLYHDDVLDSAQTRRGDPTVNSLWGNKTGVLLGDFVLLRAVRMIHSELPTDEVSRSIQAVLDLCRGEMLQAEAINSRRVLTIEEYATVAKLKTGALFRLAFGAGGRLSEATTRIVSCLERFGEAVGYLYQIIDDCLDIVCNVSDNMKDVRNDIQCGTSSLPVVHLFDGLNESEHAVVLNRLFDNASDGQKSVDFVCDLIQSRGALRSALSEAGRVLHGAQDLARHIAASSFGTASAYLESYIEPIYAKILRKSH